MRPRVFLSHDSGFEYLKKYSAFARREYRDNVFASRTSAELLRPQASKINGLGTVATTFQEIDKAGLTLREEPVYWEDASDSPSGFCPIPLSEPIHVLVPDGEKSRMQGRVVRHVWSGPIYPLSIWKAGSADLGFFRQASDPVDIFVCGPELVFFQMARTFARGIAQTKPHSLERTYARFHALIDILLLGMELCGTYSLQGLWNDSCAYRRKPLTSTKRIASVLNHLPDAQRCKLAAEALRYMADGSASQMETSLYLLLCLPKKYGGYGIPKAKPNTPIPVTDRFKEIAHRDWYVPDLFWNGSGAGVDVEYDSSEFHDDYDSITDRAMRENALQAMGIQVRSVTWDIIAREDRLETVAHQVCRLLGLHWRSTTLTEAAMRHSLRTRVLPYGYH